MTPQHWQKVKSILAQAIEIAPESRSIFLEKKCRGDNDLRREVENLLEFEKPETDLLEQEAVDAVLENHSNIGKTIGNYKIIDELGAGGMGAVFLAERADGEFEQKVAVKLIKNSFGSEQMRRRFRNERQILATLEHPNIAHLIDGGTTVDGLPFLVMEYVEGAPITEYANTNNLNLEQRLDLFREVCAAVSFAHQKLIIHRDLKPSNVFVTKNGKVKLLDFGIAKLLKNEIGNETQTQHFAFTPEYASPEQIRGESLSTATDIYSLGIILYELLTGSRPFQFEGKNMGEIIQTITESLPIRPSSVVLSPLQIEQNETFENKGQRTKGEKQNPKSKIQNPKSLRGDLDNIILKALKKEPHRRYSSVEQFAEDIRRHLQGLPVTARQDTWRYRAEKFAQRNPLVVGAVGLAFLILIGGILTTLYQARKANIEREKAERRFKDVRTLANSFMFEINEQIEKSPIKARELLVQRAIEYLDKLAAESENDTELQSELAAAYEKIGNIQSELFKPSLGKTSDALASHQKSLEIREKLFAAEPDKIQRGLDAAKSRQLVGDIFSMSGRVNEARANYQQTIELNRRLLTMDAKNIAVQRSLAGSYARLGQSILRSGSLAEALANYQSARQIFENIAVENPNDKDLQRSLSIIFSYIGYVEMEMGATNEAVRFFTDSLNLTEKNADAASLKSRADLSIAHIWVGVALSEDGKYEKSLQHLQKALELQTSVFEADKNNFGERNGLADCFLELGKAAVNAKKPDEAIKNLSKAIENYEAVYQTDQQNFSARRQIAFSQIFLANAFQQKEDAARAQEIYEKAFKTLQELTALDADNTEWQHDLSICHLRIGEILLAENNKNSALQHFETAKSMLEKLSAQSPEYAKRRADLEKVQNLLAK